MKKEEWIEYVSSAATEIGKAEPDPYLFSRINQQLSETKAVRVVPVNNGQVLRWAIAASVILALNIVVITSTANHKKQNKSQYNLEALSTEMGLSDTYNY